MPKNLRDALKDQLTGEELEQLRAFDIIGDIAVIKLPKELLPKKGVIGRALMQVHRHLRTVLRQVGPVGGEFRTRELEVIAGEPRTKTLYRESGCVFKADLAQVYFSPRLAHERLRIASQVKPGEVVTNMFAGVGCYSIIIAKRSKATKIYSIDKNPVAVQYLRENIRINKVGDRVVPILGDAREVVPQLAGRADRVLMPLPELAREFFDVALRALKRDGGVIHFYDYGRQPDIFGPSLEFARSTAAIEGREVELLDGRAIRSYAPRCYHIALDLLVRTGSD
ncbi:MAG: class I SAM-dependent methyltransferase family protein [Candidatus Hodarchaeaceae archaeon]|nr:class I SAM-dependent methyltransferase family protein [Candidatus Hodarchaeaceae archaeon]